MLENTSTGTFNEQQNLFFPLPFLFCKAEHKTTHWRKARAEGEYY